ncbi:FmdB family zinc ribbon protein [Phytoactinopolyspora mesophila]|uniref:Zinc ribbon domain-containing protein n=1 Tax=Phytoactinopolyspora mesophila TaxID=2650750 RepID=A0A7K3M8L0_9ACTN|nr:zinc ribbon domain-containing protein [Phytoactinopolyspora mesophila]
MALYEYRCAGCGIFEVARAMGSAPSSHPCARCGSDARRSFSIPHVNRAPTPLRKALDRAEKSRDEPAVVTRVPPQRDRQPGRQDPRRKHLPTP